MCSCDGSTESSVASPQLASQCHTKRWLAGVRPEAEVEGVKQEDPEEWQPEAEVMWAGGGDQRKDRSQVVKLSRACGKQLALDN